MAELVESVQTPQAARPDHGAVGDRLGGEPGGMDVRFGLRLLQPGPSCRERFNQHRAVIGEQVVFGVGPHFVQHGGIVRDHGPQAYSLGGKHPANLAHPPRARLPIIPGNQPERVGLGCRTIRTSCGPLQRPAMTVVR